MEGHSYHRAYFGKVNINHTVVIRYIRRLLLLVSLGAEVGFVPLPCFVVGHPYGGKAGGFGSHNVYAVSEVHAEVFNAVADKLHNPVFNVAVFENRAYYGKGNVLRAYAFNGLARKVNAYNLGHIHIIGFAEELFYKLGAAFTDSHSTQSAVACMAVAA